jgi:hypothetical protein
MIWKVIQLSNDITVTMTLEHYESMKEQIEKLKALSVYNFIEFTSPEGFRKPTLHATIKQNEIVDKIRADHKHVEMIFIKSGEGLLVKPLYIEWGDPFE